MALRFQSISYSSLNYDLRNEVQEYKEEYDPDEDTPEINDLNNLMVIPETDRDKIKKNSSKVIVDHLA